MQLQSFGSWGWTSRKASLLTCLAPELEWLEKLGAGQMPFSLLVGRLGFPQHGGSWESVRSPTRQLAFPRAHVSGGHFDSSSATFHWLHRTSLDTWKGMIHKRA